LTVTVFDAFAVQPLAVVTVALYVVVAAGVTVMVCVEAPVDHWYVANPAPASSVTLPPVQVEKGPLIETAGGCVSVTAVAAEVPLQPAAAVAVTE
jgi:hypothetical protein